MNKRNGYLTRRDRRILAFVDRYRAVIHEMLQDSILTSADSRANSRRILRRLVRRGLLQSYQYAPGKSYFVITRNGCRWINSPNRMTRAFTEQSLPAAMAIAWFCLKRGVSRFTDREFRLRFPDLWKPGLRSSAYYLLETPDGLKLGMFVVDRGGGARSILKKIRRLTSQRASLPAFEALMQANRFRITVLTGLPAQQANIQRQLKKRRVGRLDVEVVIIPELGELLTLK